MMFCLLEFLSDDYQANLRAIAQNYSERFELALNYYGKLFKNHKKLCGKKCHEKDCHHHKVCSQYYNIIHSIKLNDIDAFFDNIQECYIKWIDAKPDESLHKFKQLLSDYNILDIHENLDKNLLYYKGRNSSDELSRYDMFHIPFNKRYLISNQRYSLTGQPIIYLGKSILDIIRELEISDFKNLNISYVRFNESLKLFNGRNNLFENIVDRPIGTFFPNTSPIYSENIFFKNILVWICSFVRKHPTKYNNFCEEYVVPQLLSQILKEKNFDGVIYTSTKSYSDINSENKIKLKNIDICDNAYKENIALFTNYSKDNIYDDKLKKDIFISHPINIYHIRDITIADIDKIQSQASKLTKSQDKVVFVEQNIQWFKRVFKSMKIQDDKFLESKIGKIHMNLLYNALNDILTL